VSDKYALVQLGDLDQLHALDQEITSETAPAVVDRTVSMWHQAHRNGELCEVLQWGIIYSLRATVIPSGEHAGKAKWQITILDPRYPLALTWEEFCINHLGMSPGEASNKKRNWEIYKRDLGYDLIDLLIAGVQRLNVARAMIADCAKKTPVIFPEKLLTAVFGEPHICLACQEHVWFTDRVPETCPHCEAGYQYLEPATVTEVKAIISKLKGNPPDKPHVQADIEETDDALTVLPFFVDGQGNRYTLPAWSVPILATGQGGDLGGIPEEAKEALAKWMRGRFKEIAQ
jgi:hypothetical protein